jgi:hypothetical protein
MFRASPDSCGEQNSRLELRRIPAEKQNSRFSTEQTSAPMPCRLRLFPQTAQPPRNAVMVHRSRPAVFQSSQRYETTVIQRPPVKPQGEGEGVPLPPVGSGYPLQVLARLRLPPGFPLLSLTQRQGNAPPAASPRSPAAPSGLSAAIPHAYRRT